MDPSISKDAVRRVSASAAPEAELSVKRFKAEDGSSQTPKGPEQKSSSAGKKRTEEATNPHSEGNPLFSKHWDDMGHMVEQIGLKTILENPAVALEQFELFCSSAKEKFPDEWTSFQRSMAESTFLEHYAFMKINHFQLMACLYELNKRRLTLEDDFKKSKATLEATISTLNEIISNLNTEVAINSSKLSEADAKLRKSESSKMQLNTRIESLEANLLIKNKFNDVLRGQAIVLEQKASSYKKKALSLGRKIIEFDKYSKELSSAAAKAIKDFKSS